MKTNLEAFHCGAGVWVTCDRAHLHVPNSASADIRTHMRAVTAVSSRCIPHPVPRASRDAPGPSHPAQATMDLLPVTTAQQHVLESSVMELDSVYFFVRLLLLCEVTQPPPWAAVHSHLTAQQRPEAGRQQVCPVTAGGRPLSSVQH